MPGAVKHDSGRFGPPTWTPVPRRVAEAAARRGGRQAAARRRLDELAPPPAPIGDQDGDSETLGTVTAVHRFVDAPGDSETVRWHLVECGPPTESAPTVVFLHGLPDSWWQWHHALAEFGQEFHCLAVDLKGYGQSDKRTGDFRQRGVAEQLGALLDTLGVGRYALVTHDRGTAVADYLVARDPYRVERYARGQQHLWHLHPDLYPQEARFAAAPKSGLFADAFEFVAMTYGTITEHDISEADLLRTVQEFSHPGIADAVPRYFNSSSFRQEWIDRRSRLIGAWRCPVLLMQGRHDLAQPWEFYADPDALSLLPDGSDVSLLDGGHLWPLEVPDEANAILRDFLT